MNPCTIGLLGSPEDEQVADLARALGARGARAVTVDLTEIPAYVRFHWHRDELVFGDLDLGSLDAAYARTGWFPQPVRVVGMNLAESQAHTLHERETGALLNSIVSELEQRVPVINPPGTYHYHRQKPFMYRQLARAGVPVPDFAVGCDLEQTAYFVQGHAEATVVKPLMGGEVLLADSRIPARSSRGVRAPAPAPPAAHPGQEPARVRGGRGAGRAGRGRAR